MSACLLSGLLETLVETLPDPDTPHLKPEHMTDPWRGQQEGRTAGMGKLRGLSAMFREESWLLVHRPRKPTAQSLTTLEEHELRG